MEADDHRDIDLREIAHMLRRRAWMIALITVAAVTGTYLFASSSPDRYDATSRIRVTNPNTENVFSTPNINIDPRREVETQSEMIQSADIRAAVDEALGGRAALLEDVAVKNLPGTDILEIRTKSTSRELARDAANAYADVFVAERREKTAANLNSRATELRSAAGALRQRIAELDAQIASSSPAEADALRAQRSSQVSQQAEFNEQASQLEVEAAIRRGNVEIVERAQLPEWPSAPRPKRDAAIAGLLALAAALGLTFLLDRLDDRLRDPSEIEQAAGGAAVLGALPIYRPDGRRGNKKLAGGPRSLVPLGSQAAESYRTLRTNLRFSNLGEAKKIILVTSSTGSEGKSTTTSNLAVSLAEGGQRVVVVSADLRRPTLSSVYGVTETSAGLTSVLLGDAQLSDCLVPVETESGNRLYVLPTGPLPHNPAEILGAKAMGDLLHGLAAADVDYVLIDSPPVLPVSDSLALAQFVDGVIVLTVVGQTRAHHLTIACERLRTVGAEIIGVVANGIDSTNQAYSYSYGYSSAYTTAGTEPVSRRRPLRKPTLRTEDPFVGASTTTSEPAPPKQGVDSRSTRSTVSTDR